MAPNKHLSMSIRAFLVHPQSLRRTSCVVLWPYLHTAMEHSDHQAIMGKCSSLTMPLKCSFIPLAISSSISRPHPIGAVVAETCESSDVLSESSSHPNPHYNMAIDEVRGVTCLDFDPTVTNSIKETQRRRRIGLANKGKVPWNKGRKHSPETCARIKERTLEALRNPKVRKKMSESPRMHSEHSKRKIGSSLKKLWAERLKRKRSKEMFYLSWADSIAEAARRGGIDEEQLDWDSYERLKVEMAYQQLQLDEENAKEKEMKRNQAVKKVLERERNRNAELRAKKKKRMSCKAKNEKEGVAASRKSKTSDKSTKVVEKKSIDAPPSTGVMIYLQSALEKFDIESIKAEQRRNTVSLADQIQAAKSRRQGVSSSTTITTNPVVLNQIST